jgi:hypothetical protein
MLHYGIEIPQKFDTPIWTLAILKWLKDFKWNYDTLDQTLKSISFNANSLTCRSKMFLTRIRAYCCGGELMQLAIQHPTRGMDW